MSSLKSFLSRLKTSVSSGSVGETVRFVTGNQSADMDSVVSAISYAYFHHLKDPSSSLIPMINIPRQDLHLRRDIKILLQLHSVNEDLLFFLEDFRAIAAECKKVELVLVDHCNIQGEILTSFFRKGRLNVVGIVDHHADEKAFLKANPRIIQTSGSCSSLVFNYWYHNLDDRTILQNNEIIELLMGPLLIDTSNMTQKVEENDVEALEKYRGLLNIGEDERRFNVTDIEETTSKLTSSDLYRQLKQAKKDLDGFSFYDILRKDYKQFTFSNTTVGFSSIGKGINWILKKFSVEEVVDTLSSISKDLGLDILVMTTTYTDKNDKYTREFCYHYKDDKYAELWKHADELQLEKLELNRLDEINRLTTLKVFNQVNIKASRKQVVPAVKSVLEERMKL